MPAPKRPTAAQLQKQCDKWNAANTVGTLVSFENVIGDGETHRGKSVSEAQILSGHSAVIWLEGYSGCVLLSHCTAVAEEVKPESRIEVQKITFEDRGQDFLEWYVRDGIVIDCQPHQGMIWVGTKLVYPQGLPLTPGRIINLISPSTGKVSDLKYPVESIETLSEFDAEQVEGYGRKWADMKGLIPSDLGL